LLKASLVFDPNAGGDVEAHLDFEADGLTIFGPGGRKLQHWPYGEIMHALPEAERKDGYLAHPNRPEIRLQVRSDPVYDAIRARSPQLRRRRFGWWWFWSTLQGMPHDAQLGLYLLAAIVIFTIYHFSKGVFE
jgi:hypothetical protein